MSFLNAGLLGLGALFTVPLLIHLLNKRRYQRVPWAAMHFLLKAYKQNRRRLRLQNLLLLLLRCAIPILLALAIARPQLGSRISLGVDNSSTHHILLLDRSYSMGARSGAGGSPFENMRRISQALVDHIGQQENDHISLLLFDSRVSTPVRDELGISGAKRALTALDAPRDTVAHLVPAVRSAMELLDEGKKPGVLYIFSDFQDSLLDHLAQEQKPGTQKANKQEPQPKSARSDKPAAPKPASPESADPRFRELADLFGDLRERDCEIRLLPLAPRETPQNSQIVKLRLLPQNAVARVGATLQAELRHMGGGSRELLARMAIDGKNPQTRRVTLETGKLQSIEFPLRFLEEGMHSIQLSLEEDALPVDDLRQLVVHVRDRIRVLLVEGRDQDAGSADLDPILGESFLWDRLLDPSSGEGKDELLTFQTTVVDEDRFQADPSYFQGQDLIVLAGLSGPRGSVAARLTQFVEKGGGLLIIPGPGSSADLFNSRLFGSAGEKGPLPLRLLGMRGFLGKLGNVAGGSIPSRYLTPRIEDREHPMLHDFASDKVLAEILQRTPVYRYFAASLADRPKDTRLLLGLTGAEDPSSAVLLAVRSFGRGHCALLSSNISKRPSRWNRLDDLWVALPLMHSLVHGLAEENPERLNRLVGQGLSAWLPERPQGLWVTSPGSEQRSAVALPEREAMDSVLGLGQRSPGFLTPAFGRTFKSGIYTLEAEFEGRTRATQRIPFAVAPDPAEGELRYFSQQQLQQELPMAQVQQRLELDDHVEAATGATELGRFFMILVLIFGILESLLAALLGGRRR
ncbi:MAG: hypothetical protein CSA62_10205 [Planctomycetota bacterium]|nr:MAG: hypothetical protein CSA62_10205 [Planctomycetota bacterium]